jgi:hypothetical protein
LRLGRRVVGRLHPERDEPLGQRWRDRELATDLGGELQAGGTTRATARVSARPPAIEPIAALM